MVIQHISLPVSELAHFEVICPTCELAFTFEGTHWTHPSCPVCDAAFGLRFTEALRNYARFAESVRALDVGLNFLVKVNDVEAKQETQVPEEVASATG